MASIFNSLHIGYSGLNAAQIAIDTTGHNIANAETEGYTRQRVNTSNAHPVTISPGLRGNGVEVDSIVRIFDSFVYERYTSTAESKEYSDFTRETMETLSTYFPEIEGVGVKAEMQEFFNMWQSFADNPDNEAMKVALAEQTKTLSQSIHQTYGQVSDLQAEMNLQLVVSVDEVNRLGEEIAGLNLAIEEAELAHLDNANDLRDKRDLLELSMAKLLGTDVFGGRVVSDMRTDRDVAERTGHYNIHVEGFNLVDGTTFHPIGITNEDNPEGFHDLYYERQDHVRIPIATEIEGGKIGAILDLRGSKLDSVTGIPQDGTLQEVLDQLDSFAAGMIESTNNIYARSATERMQSNTLEIDPHNPLITSGLHLQAGTFDVVAYDIDGQESSRRTITITTTTVMDDSDINPPNGTLNSIVGQLNAAIDDNDDNNSGNDMDSILDVNFSAGMLNMSVSGEFNGYSFSIEDSSEDGQSSATNFAGAIGISRFFEGDTAGSIDLDRRFRDDPTEISAHAAPIDGDNRVALDMVQLQFEQVSFTRGERTITDTLYGFYDSVATYVGSKTNSAIVNNETITAQYNAVESEYFSVSKVSIDEELTNLIRYQTAYGAAAKIITTIDEMMNTLLGIKQ